MRVSRIVSGMLAVMLLASARLRAEPPVPASGKAASPRRENRLAKESSPYLLQHARNPVDWRPWGPEALELARRENKPIFLSIGYSSCYWCHVMERQVFENEEIAADLNAHFVCIKVDREERPDLDEVYMLALQVYLQLAGSSQGGGWPLSLFLTPDAQPIAGGTYFPPADQPGRPGFPKVLRQIRDAWRDREQDVRRTAELVCKEVERLSRPPAVEEVRLGPELVQGAVSAAAESYDPVYGGFGFRRAAPEGPKFPSPCTLQLLQAQIGRPDAPPGSAKYADMIDQTLTRMAAGGIRDHLGGGFHRYSTDRRWEVPHFEKMLYDNAQLAEIYAEAFRRTGREAYRQVAEDIFAFVLRDLTSPEGGFYAAIDAESNGEEGQYYLWSRTELEQALGPGPARFFVAAYGPGAETAANEPHELRLRLPLDQTAERLGMPQSDLQARLHAARRTLWEQRQRRPPPATDQTVLTGWNGLMIRALARGSQAVQSREYRDAAVRAALFLLSSHRDAEGRLLHASRQGRPGGPAFLDDYACFANGLLALHEATGEEKWLSAARRLTDDQISLFSDPATGGFFLTPHDQPPPLARMQTAYDGVLPSGNSVSVMNLTRLARLKSDDHYRISARRTLTAFAPQLSRTPENFAALALGLQEYLHWYGGSDRQAAGEGLFLGGVSSPAAAPQPAMRPQPPTAAPADGPVALLLPAADQARLHPQIRAQGFLSVDRLQAGGKCRVAVEVVIAEDWHLNANPPQPDFVIPTQLTLAGPIAFELRGVAYPPGAPFTVQGIEEPLSVYEGTIYLVGTLEIPQDAQGDQELIVQLSYQACNRQNCQRPMRLRLMGQMPVAPAGTPSAPANEALFQKLDAARQAP